MAPAGQSINAGQPAALPTLVASAMAAAVASSCSSIVRVTVLRSHSSSCRSAQRSSTWPHSQRDTQLSKERKGGCRLRLQTAQIAQIRTRLAAFASRSSTAGNTQRHLCAPTVAAAAGPRRRTRGVVQGPQVLDRLEQRVLGLLEHCVCIRGWGEAGRRGSKLRKTHRSGTEQRRNALANVPWLTAALQARGMARTRAAPPHAAAGPRSALPPCRHTCDGLHLIPNRLLRRLHGRLRDAVGLLVGLLSCRQLGLYGGDLRAGRGQRGQARTAWVNNQCRTGLAKLPTAGAQPGGCPRPCGKA